MSLPIRTNRGRLPFVLVNMAMTADGKIATTNRLVSSFSSRRDGQHLLELRATADAVMAGARTVDLIDVEPLRVAKPSQRPAMTAASRLPP